MSGPVTSNTGAVDTGAVPAEKDLVEAIARELSARKTLDDLLGVKLLEMAAGYVKMRMTVTDRMTNFYGSAHGGAIFALADSAFAYACNSGNRITVAAGCSIEYLAPAHPGDVLTATARYRGGVGRQGIYDIDIHNQEGRLIATFRGKSHSTKDSILPEAQALPPSE
ncbi:hydroxyphenylacetyl-CoA thioesterase PaaI [Luteithermobacter gelatinilyticus]|uniref:hydroxyphenylacetyl-CoA thioesterase PaaI n=1 Tax=Luteithermobacter gelatinilyticus TaxID=2582913 RepID=UPI001106AB34|nr:hydroxyphenylacetyl-CoA thioesterase PaaI [Luteithermobacter gelatinilyticus]